MRMCPIAFLSQYLGLTVLAAFRAELKICVAFTPEPQRIMLINTVGMIWFCHYVVPYMVAAVHMCAAGLNLLYIRDMLF